MTDRYKEARERLQKHIEDELFRASKTHEFKANMSFFLNKLTDSELKNLENSLHQLRQEHYRDFDLVDKFNIVLDVIYAEQRNRRTTRGVKRWLKNEL